MGINPTNRNTTANTMSPWNGFTPNMMHPPVKAIEKAINDINADSDKAKFGGSGHRMKIRSF